MPFGQMGNPFTGEIPQPFGQIGDPLAGEIPFPFAGGIPQTFFGNIEMPPFVGNTGSPGGVCALGVMDTP